jgi:phosphoglycerate dehydrogenase-like enzyme
MSPSDRVPDGWTTSVYTANSELDSKPQRVVVTSDVHERAVEILEEDPLIRVEYIQKKINAELLGTLLGDEKDPVRGLIVRTEGHDLLRDHPSLILDTQWLDVIVRAGIGVDKKLAQTALKKGIKLMNTPEANRDNVHKEVVRRMLDMTHPIVVHQRQARRQVHGLTKKDWKTKTKVYPKDATENPVAGKVVHIIGAGGIGERVAFDMNRQGARVIYTDTDPSKNLYFAERVDLHDGLKRADIISIHVNGEEQVLGKEEIACINPKNDRNVIFINTARGAVVDGSALHEAVVSGKIDGAYLDVLPVEENKAFEDPNTLNLLQNPLIDVTFHSLGGREDALMLNATDGANKVRGALRSGVVVDPYGGVEMSLPPHLWENGGPVIMQELINEDVPNVHDGVEKVVKSIFNRYYPGQELNISGSTTRESNYKVPIDGTNQLGRMAFHLSRLHFPADIRPEVIQEIIKTCIVGDERVPGLVKMRIREYRRK